MNSKNTLEYIKKFNKYINDNPEIARIEIDIDLINALEQAQKDLEKFEELKKKKYLVNVDEKGNIKNISNIDEFEKAPRIEPSIVYGSGYTLPLIMLIIVILFVIFVGGVLIYKCLI